ncbi:hypothetical protein [Bremerella cremea]|uniref:hypothetical protein n=1 Tax=Bremerella cremea TaxID=1031537 RepID=UPI0031EB9EEE
MHHSISTVLTVLALLIALLFGSVIYVPGPESEREVLVTIMVVFAIVANLPKVIAMAWPVSKEEPSETAMKRTKDDKDNPYRPPESY